MAVGRVVSHRYEAGLGRAPAPSPSIIESDGWPLLVSSDQRRRRLVLQGLDARQRLVHRTLAVIWIVFVIGLGVWWFQPGHQVSVLRTVISSVLLSWSILLPAWFLYFVGRVSRVSESAPVPELRVAMVVTKTSSEPWDMVQNTLTAMLSQPPAHDTWLADERPEPNTLAWCEANGVQVSCRAGVDGYHRAAWPRRTRTKEGNLAHFYDNVGYDEYDVVVQLDADHVPESGYLEAMLRPFSDPAVGYVSAPSICDANAQRSWAVRARAYAEAPLHGALQAASNVGYAPLCIGSHYAVRTEALRDIGGIGPELAEDHSTTLMMNAAGWRGIHAFDAEAHGDGPESYPDLIVQEFQWARSLVNVLLCLTPRMLRPLSWKLRIQFLFSQLWYPAFSVVMLVSVIFPIVALATGTPWMRLSYIFFLGWAGALTATLLALVGWVKKQGWLRPVDAPVLSWESGLFQLARWPWALAGCAAAVVDRLRGDGFAFKITPKRTNEYKPIPLITVAPHLTIAAVSVAATLLIDNPGEARGYYWFTLINSVLYTVTVAAIVGLHLRENRAARAGTERRGLPWPHVVILAVLGVLTAAACASRSDDVTDALTWTGPGSTTPVADDPVDRASGVIDITAGSVNIGIYDAYDEYGDSNRFAIGHHFVSWLYGDADDTTTLVTADLAAGRWPMLTVEPEPLPGTEDTLLVDIAEGRYDAPMREICEGLAATGSPAFVRWGHEMEVVTGRYAWATEDAPAYVDAFRRSESVCREVLGDDLFMVWSPIGEEGLDAYWPGADAVDYVGLPVLDFPDYLQSVGLAPDLTFDELFWPRYERVSVFDKPLMIAEFGTTRTGDDKVDWINEAFASTPDYPLLRTVVFFHSPDTPGAWGDDVDTPTWRVEPATLPSGEPNAGE